MTWYIDGSASMGNLDVFQTDKELGDYRVCMIDCDDETVSESDHEANARLIMAAPDLLAALEAVLPDLWDGIELATEQSVNEAWLADALHRLDAARAAVNKAKGADA
jgi:hypothetical protein